MFPSQYLVVVNIYFNYIHCTVRGLTIGSVLIRQAPMVLVKIAPLLALFNFRRLFVLDSILWQLQLVFPKQSCRLHSSKLQELLLQLPVLMKIKRHQRESVHCNRFNPCVNQGPATATIVVNVFCDGDNSDIRLRQLSALSVVCLMSFSKKG